MAKKFFRCPQRLDEMGVLEEYTNDLADFVTPDIAHLDSDGLPRIGAEIRPGMILIGKIGGKKVDDHAKTMNELERLCASRDELRTYWQKRGYDGSLYAPGECVGNVVAAYFDVDADGNKVAVVEME